MSPLDAGDPFVIARIRAGDHAIFESVFRTHYAALCGFAANLVGSMAVAEDVVQEVFRRVWEGRERWQVRDTVKTYLYKAVRNEAFNHLRHRRVEDRFQGSAHAERAPGMSEGPGGIEGDLEAAELAAAIERAVQGLPDRCREVFLLKWQGHLRYAEIAAAMNISVKTVENQMLRALRTIRECVDEHLQ